MAFTASVNLGLFTMKTFKTPVIFKLMKLLSSSANNRILHFTERISSRFSQKFFFFLTT